MSQEKVAAGHRYVRELFEAAWLASGEVGLLARIRLEIEQLCRTAIGDELPRPRGESFVLVHLAHDRAGWPAVVPENLC